MSLSLSSLVLLDFDSEVPPNCWTRKNQYKEELMRKKRRRYAEAFKKESVEYLISSGKPIIHVARELGLNDATLGTWKRQYAGDPTVKTPALEELTVDELKRELKRLKKENEYLKRQREILKKAMSILSQEPNGEMR